MCQYKCFASITRIGELKIHHSEDLVKEGPLKHGGILQNC